MVSNHSWSFPRIGLSIEILLDPSSVILKEKHSAMLFKAHKKVSIKQI